MLVGMGWREPIALVVDQFAGQERDLTPTSRRPRHHAFRIKHLPRLTPGTGKRDHCLLDDKEAKAAWRRIAA